MDKVYIIVKKTLVPKLHYDTEILGVYTSFKRAEKEYDLLQKIATDKAEYLMDVQEVID